ncbi:MAG TPA: T9SS type B sorting domain-containing protein, partial [Flavobacteriaceae bacterium]|nr:T9SS type B sorting domain-containing protein [Flavobacteriaceae bacterium]
VKPTRPAFADNGGALVYNITGDGDYEFRIDDGPWLTPGADGTVQFNNLTPGQHYIYGRDKGGCGTTVIPFSLIDYPDFFTPNDDGYNDSWNISGLENQPNAKIYIFDRYGKLLKQIRPDGPGWDGVYNGKELPSNDYWFRVEYQETTLSSDGTFTQFPATFKGHFTLKR